MRIHRMRIHRTPDEDTPDEDTPDEDTPDEDTPDEDTPDEDTPEREGEKIYTNTYVNVYTFLKAAWNDYKTRMDGLLNSTQFNRMLLEMQMAPIFCEGKNYFSGIGNHKLEYNGSAYITALDEVMSTAAHSFNMSHEEIRKHAGLRKWMGNITLAMTDVINYSAEDTYSDALKQMLFDFQIWALDDGFFDACAAFIDVCLFTARVHSYAVKMAAEK